MPLEQYVADTVPGESPSGWGSLGGAGPQGMDWGFQELEAQAVAVRSYVLANLGGYGGYADTCDLTCQTYRGTEYETATTVAAANDTAGQVMVMPGGQIATTEYSASTGGYTSSANQQSPFTAVPDDGDAVCIARGLQPQPPMVDLGQRRATSRPRGPRSARSPVSVARRRIPAIPTTDHASGGWTPSRSTGPSQDITIPGTEFYVDLGLNSDLFSVTSTNGSTVSIVGQGWGHGIGMGQWGALGYAIGQDNGDGNWTYQQIVNTYYGPATLQQPSRAARARRRLQRRGRRVLDQRCPTVASSASATRSSTAARGACG